MEINAKDFIILHEKKNAKKTQRGYLLYNIKWEATPLVVCSHLEIQDNEISWDWGYYFKKEQLLNAIKCMYEEEIKNNEGVIL